MEPLKSGLLWLCTDPIGLLVSIAVVLTIACYIEAFAKRIYHNYVQDKISVAYNHGFREGRDYGFAEGKELNDNIEAFAERGINAIGKYLQKQGRR